MTPQRRFRIAFKIILAFCFFFFSQDATYAKTISTFANSLKNAVSDTAKKDTSSLFETHQRLIDKDRVLFYGTWADFFSSFLKIKRDSTFNYTWGFNGRSCWTAGKWERKKDTFYLMKNPDYDNVSGQSVCPLPDKLCYFKYKLYLLDSSDNPIKGKIPSRYMGRKSPPFKTFYFRSKRYNLDYFDSTHYRKTMQRHFRFGYGVNVMIQPVPAFPTAVSLGFIVSARYIFERKEHAYLSLDLPLTLGFTGLRDSISIEPHAGPMLDVPLTLNYNHMFGIVKQGARWLEYYIGGGASYHYNEYSVSENPSVDLGKVNGIGAMVNIGIRFAQASFQRRNFELRFSYTKMMVNSKADIMGIGALLNF